VVFQPPGEAIVVEEDVKQPLNSHNEDAGLLPALMATPPRMPRRGGGLQGLGLAAGGGVCAIYALQNTQL
jgi:hypothetical protein